MPADSRANVSTEIGNLQVANGHYDFARYDELHRWTSYWYQIDAIVRTGANTILEVGGGSGVTGLYLRNKLGLTVMTVDFDPSRAPTVVADIRELDKQVSEQSHDCVVAFQVLEHLPYEYFVPCLRQLMRASRSAVVISLPHAGWSLQWRLRLLRWTWAFSRKLPRWRQWKFDGQHYWEIGTREHSLKSVRADIASVLDVRREYFCPDYPYHYFFECIRR